MNTNRKTKTTRHLLIAALALTLAGAGSALAARPDNCPYAGSQMEQRHNARMKDLSRLHDELKLDAKQEALWQEAEEKTRAAMGDMRERMRRQREQLLASVSQPNADLHAVFRQLDELRDAGRDLREANRTRWLAVYDSLDPAQKEKARLFVKSQIERRGPFGGGGPAAGGGRRN